MTASARATAAGSEALSTGSSLERSVPLSLLTSILWLPTNFEARIQVSAMPKYYAVCVGREGPKVYTDWEECKANTSRYSGAKHKSFSSRQQAEAWIAQYLLDTPQPNESDSEVEFVEGPSISSAPRPPPKRNTPPEAVDSDSDIEFIAHIPAKSPSHQQPTSAQSATSAQIKSETPINLSPEQAKVLELIKQQKNVFFTGSAGTGKSVLLREIIQWLQGSNKKLAITAPTGIAAINIGGTTIHSWAGIGLGLDPPNKIAAKWFTNALKFQDVLSRWKQVDALIIDEISMLDGNLFDTLEYLARRTRMNDLPFGGIQLILSGDFCQLPPVPNRDNKNVAIEARFAFEAHSWGTCVGPPVVLQKVFRQKDQQFVDMLNSMRFGNLDLTATGAFHALSRAVTYDDGIEPSELFPLRREVDRANAARLKGLKTEEQVYQASDAPGTDSEGRPIPWAIVHKLLERLVVPKLLIAKVGAQVMLVKNLHDQGLVNGSIGKIERFLSVADAMKEGITIGRAQRGDGNEVPLDKDPTVARLPKERAWPVVPLILAWALSIHKSQGQTLERVKVDLRNIFEKGQAYVALSRATKLEQLQVLNFDVSKVQAHPRVLAWYQKHTKVNKEHHDDFDLDLDDFDGDIPPDDEMDEMDSVMAIKAYYS